MQNPRIIISAITGILLVMFLALFLFEFKQNTAVREEFGLKNNEFKEAKKASKRLEILEKQTAELRQKEDMLEKKVPINEKYPFELMKTLVKLGGEIGLRGIFFNIKDNTSFEASSNAQSAVPQTRPISDTELNPLFISLSFEGTFPQVVTFIQKITIIERLVTVRSLQIERQDDILPYQKVSLVLQAYTFIQQN